MKDWLERYLQPLVDGKITAVEALEEDGKVWPRIIVKTDTEEYTLEISRDEEGNGPGFVFGLPNPDAVVEDEPPSAF